MAAIEEGMICGVTISLVLSLSAVCQLPSIYFLFESIANKQLLDNFKMIANQITSLSRFLLFFENKSLRNLITFLFFKILTWNLARRWLIVSIIGASMRRRKRGCRMHWNRCSSLCRVPCGMTPNNQQTGHREVTKDIFINTSKDMI